METVEETANFLRRWSKYKPIMQLQTGSTFYKCGRWMTKIPAERVQELLDSGLARGCGSCFTMRRP